MTKTNKPENINTIPNLLTVRQFCEQFPAFSTGSIRSYIYYAEINGLKEARAIKRVGKKILIDVDAFFEWIEKKTMEAR
jgi:hypothetical protein